jgi:DNA-binding transcriptional MocR family regulator
VAPLSECYSESPRPGFVLGYGCANLDEIADGIRTLGRLIGTIRSARRHVAR